MQPTPSSEDPKRQAVRPLPAIRVLGKVLKHEAQDTGAESYLPLISNLVRNSAIYVLSSLATPFVSLILAPFLTHTLSHIEYGMLAVLNTVIALGVGITQLGLTDAFFYTYNCDYDSERDRRHIISAVVILLSLVLIPTTIATMITAPWLANFLFNSPSLSSSLRLAALVILLQNLTVPGLSWLRSENRAVFYVVLSIANLLVNVGATIVLVGVLHMGINGSLLAMGIGYAVIVACTLPVAIFHAGLHLRFDITRNLLSFGLPLVPNVLSVWILQLSDRYLLSHFGSLAQTASYAVAYSLGGALGYVVLAPFLLAWPAVAFAIAKKDNASHIYRLVFRWYSIVLLFAAYALSLIATFALDILFPPAYHSAAPIIPIIAASIMFYGIYNFFTIGADILRKTWLVTIFTTCAALVNVGLNIILIPHYGSMGAAVSTLIAYTLLALITYVVNQRIYPIPYEIDLFITALSVGIVLYIGSNILIHAQKTYVAWGISICALGFYGGCLIFLGKFPTWIHMYKPRLKKEDSVV